jgi:PPOX class probable F420-dependent enzyme
MVRRLARMQYRLLDRLRHADAARIAREPGAARDFAALRNHHYCLVVTFKRSGEPVPTPVLFALVGERVYFRTERDVAKVRRLRRNPRVRIGPCDWRAKPLGPMTEGLARLLPAPRSGPPTTRSRPATRAVNGSTRERSTACRSRSATSRPSPPPPERPRRASTSARKTFDIGR